MKSSFSSRSNRGYTLLFSVLIASLVLGVAVFILSVSRKQYILAATARESMLALYASDSGIECGALYPDLADWDVGSTWDNFVCDDDVKGVIFNLIADYPGSDAGTTKFATFNIRFLDTEIGGVYGCAIIRITGYKKSGKKITILESRGYNLCRSENDIWVPDTGSPRTVERANQLITEE